LNCIRIPFNYRHFQDDLNPSVIKLEGFRILDRIIERCAAENLYVVLDLHAVPGGQNQDWHSDSGVHKALFWQFIDFQNRMINLWKEIAFHYKGNVHVMPFLPNTPISTDNSSRLPVTIHSMNQLILHIPTFKPFTLASRKPFAQLIQITFFSWMEIRMQWISRIFKPCYPTPSTPCTTTA
jgi:hypothetical protein